MIIKFELCDESDDAYSCREVVCALCPCLCKKSHYVCTVVEKLSALCLPASGLDAKVMVSLLKTVSR